MLKADLHIHTREDPEDGFFIGYTAKDIIRIAAKRGFEVLSVTNHDSVYFNRDIERYARKKGILLIPGTEQRINEKHVLLINVNNNDLKKLRNLEDLARIKDKALVVAPHPFFFIIQKCLGRELEKHIDLFHAIEFSHFYTQLNNHRRLRMINGNIRALEIARKYKKPILGTSDSHYLYEFETTYALIDSEKNKDSVLEAVKKNRIKLVTKPMPLHLFLLRGFDAIIREGILSPILKKRFNKHR